MHHAALYGPNQAMLVTPYLMATTMLALSSFGVTIYLDYANEDLYLETTPSHAWWAREQALRILDRLGLDLIPEHESPAMLLPNGNMRIYLELAADVIVRVA